MPHPVVFGVGWDGDSDSREQLHVGEWQKEVCQPHASTSICWKDSKGKEVNRTELGRTGWGTGTGIAAYSLTRISLLELVLSGKLLYLTTFSSRAAKMKKMNRPKFSAQNQHKKLKRFSEEQKSETQSLHLTAIS